MLKQSLGSKILALLLVAALAFSLLPAQALAEGSLSGAGASVRTAASGTCGTLSWSRSASGALIISGTGVMPTFTSQSPAPWGKTITSLTIESGVVTISDNAFANCTKLVSVSLPDTLQEIGESAFSSCTALTSITIPEGVCDLGPNAFHYCTGLTEVFLPASLTSIGAGAFSGCVNLPQIVVDKDNPIYLGGKALYDPVGTFLWYSHQATDVCEVPEGVTDIGSCAFDGCAAVSEISLPSTLTYIGVAAFRECYNLLTIQIPEGVDVIDSNAFSDCINLTAVYLPQSLTAVRDYAFYYCDGLTDVYYAGSSSQWNTLVRSVKEGNDELVNASIHLESAPGLVASGACGSLTWALTDSGELSISGEGPLSPSVPVPWASYRKQITSLTIEPGVVSIGVGSFSDCTKLSEVSLPDTIRTIESAAFSNCTSLSAVVIPEGVTDLGIKVFWYCTSLAQVSLPASLTSIGVGAFAWCPALTQISVADGNPFYVGGDCLYAPNGSFLWCPMQLSGSYSLPDGVTDIGSDAFHGCDGLTNLVVPQGVTTIGSDAFLDCSSLTELSLPASLTVVGEYAFEDSWLTAVSFAGTEDQWQAVQVGNGNEALTGAEVSFVAPPSGALVKFTETGTHAALMTIQSEEVGYAVAAFYTSDGQMVETRMVPVSPGTETHFFTDLEVDLSESYWKVFFLDEQYAPVGEALTQED